MQSRQRHVPISLKILSIAALSGAMLAPAAPVHASEVVKLARLLITGKRQASRPAPPQPAAPDRDAASQPQSRSPDGELHAQNSRRSAEGGAVITID